MTSRALLITTALSLLVCFEAQAQPAPQGGQGAPQEQKKGAPKQQPAQGQQPKQQQQQQQQQPAQAPQAPRPSTAQEQPRPPAQKEPPKKELQPQPAPQRPAQVPPSKSPAPSQPAPPAAQQQPPAAPDKQPQRPAQKQPTQPQPPAAQREPAQSPPPAAKAPPATPQPPAAQSQPTQPQPPAAQGRPAQPQPPAAQTQPVQPQPPAAQTQPTQPQPPAAQTQPAQPQPPAAAASPPAQPIPRAAQGQPIQLPGTNARRVDDLRGQRREVREGNRVVIQEPDRMIIREGGRTIIRHNEVDRFRYGARDVRVDRRGNETTTVIERPDGVRIVTVTDESGRLIRRTRRDSAGRDVVIIENRYTGPAVGVGVGGFFIDLPPPAVRIPRERYIVEADHASEADIYATLVAPPVERLQRRYTLDEIRYSPQLRERMPRVDIDTINFQSGSWEVTPDQAARLAPIAAGIKRAVTANPSEVFLVEGHTDAVGAEEDNLSLSDRRAESVALVLTEQFQVPAENLTSQGYGEQQLKVPTDGPERANRRVTMRRITPLLSGGQGQQPGG